jgi:hypothetical protein
VRVELHKPSLKMKELMEVIHLVLLHHGSLMLCNVLGRSQLCVSYAWEISPTLILVPAFIFNKGQETETKNGSTSLNTREPKCYYYYYFFYIIYYLLIHFFSFLSLFWQGRADIISFLAQKWPFVWMKLPPPHLDFCVKVKCAMWGFPFECVPLQKSIDVYD